MLVAVGRIFRTFVIPHVHGTRNRRCSHPVGYHSLLKSCKSMGVVGAGLFARSEFQTPVNCFALIEDKIPAIDQTGSPFLGRRKTGDT